MVKKYKHLLFSFLLIVVLLSVSQTALALEVEPYPELNFAGRLYTVDVNTSLIKYAEYVFIFLIATAGFIGVVSIAIAGLRILFSAGSPTAVTDARERIFGAILGIVLLMTSFIILRTINPSLINDAASSPVASVWYRGEVNPNTYQGEGEVFQSALTGKYHAYRLAPQSEADVAKKLEGSVFNELYYYCDNPADTKKLLVWTYVHKNFQIDWVATGSSFSRTDEMPCNTPLTIAEAGVFTGSFKWNYKEPGIYFYTNAHNGTDCQGISSEALKGSGNIPPFDRNRSFSQRARCMKIVSGTDSREIYGVLLSRNTDLGGECSIPDYNLVPDSDKIVGLSEFEAKYMHIVNFDKNLDLRPNDSVRFYSKDFVAEIKQKATMPVPADPAAVPPVPAVLGDPFLPGVNTYSIEGGAKIEPPQGIGEFLYIGPHPAPVPAVAPGNPLNPIFTAIGVAGGAFGGLVNYLWGGNNPPPDTTETWFPHKILRPKGVIPTSRGVRYTAMPHSVPQEETYAQRDGRGKGSAYFDGASPSSLGFSDPFPTYKGKEQCNDYSRECMRAVEHNGLYYTVLYTLNPRTGDPSCTIIGGPVPNIKVELGEAVRKERIIYGIAIIPTTP